MTITTLATYAVALLLLKLRGKAKTAQKENGKR
jgi:hypothetical protein